MWKDCFASKIQVATAALPAAAAALRPIFMAPSSGDTHKAFGYQGSVLSWLVDCSPPGARPVEPCRARCSPAAVETSRVENAARGGCSLQFRTSVSERSSCTKKNSFQAQEASLAALKLEIAEASSTLEAGGGGWPERSPESDLRLP